MMNEIINNLNSSKINYNLVIKPQLPLLINSLSETASRNAMITFKSPVKYFDNKKWLKRWLHLYNNTLYLSKSDGNKQHTFICSLLSFDVYSFFKNFYDKPKDNLFILKSQDNISLFENKDDFIHLFEVESGTLALEWIRLLTQARTNTLIHEKPWLFNSSKDNSKSLDTFKTNLTPTKSISRSRSIPHKPTLVQNVKNVQNNNSKGTLLDFQSQSIFTKGSLLARRDSNPNTPLNFLNNDPSKFNSIENNVTRKRSGTIPSKFSYKSR